MLQAHAIEHVASVQSGSHNVGLQVIACAPPVTASHVWSHILFLQAFSVAQSSRVVQAAQAASAVDAEAIMRRLEAEAQDEDGEA